MILWNVSGGRNPALFLRKQKGGMNGAKVRKRTINPTIDSEEPKKNVQKHH